MTKKMLIDAAHPEEIRVALLDQGKVEDFDFESAARKPLRGNIYLARVTRVEPSLQAAFVEYGGNRHGFLAFSEIHPDYYQVPVSDRKLLQEAEAEVADLAAKLELTQRGDDEADRDDDNDDIADIDDENEDHVSAKAADDNGSHDDEEPKDPSANEGDPDKSSEEEEEEEDVKKGDGGSDEPSGKSSDDDGSSYDAQAIADGDQPKIEISANDDDMASEPVDANGDEENDDDDADEDEDGDDEDGDDDQPEIARDERSKLFEAYKEAKRKRSSLLRNYKIQEVIKRRQILLIQVVKEERGNKGAALTTYMSLAGRYCVLMPNTARGGGISRKISTSTDRRRLRRVVDSLEVPKGMGLIIRTAGAKRTKTEIKRDYDYLLRLWENIRALTLKSIAPSLIYEEASLIKRAIRDLYDKDISSVLVEGEEGYREAKDFMKMLMPSHAKHVQPYKDNAPIFLRHNVEAQLDGMYQPSVRLKSGGYIVIHQTEALVAIDVNSGRATRERNIEQTALKTNIEAAHEAARQFRLRDLAGLIVIDFIDMDEAKNNRKVEKAIKDALKNDRARIQIGRISNFGLMEMSRQRRRSGIVDGTTQICPTCNGAGAIRSHEMASLRILRAVEGEAISGKVGQLSVRTSLDVSLYILNHHRDWLKRIEDANGVIIEVIADSTKAGDDYDIEKSGAPRERKIPVAVQADHTEAVDEDASDVAEDEAETADDDNADEDGAGKKKRRRRRRKKDNREARDSNDDIGDNSNDSSDDDGSSSEAETSANDDNSEDKPKRRRRRGRRGGRRNKKSDDVKSDDGSEAGSDTEASNADPSPEPAERKDHTADTSGAREDQTQSGDAPAKQAEPTAKSDPEPAVVPASMPEPEPTPVRAEDASQAAAAKPDKPARKGWWQRVSGK